MLPRLKVKAEAGRFARRDDILVKCSRKPLSQRPYFRLTREIIEEDQRKPLPVADAHRVSCRHRVVLAIDDKHLGFAAFEPDVPCFDERKFTPAPHGAPQLAARRYSKTVR